MTEMIKFVVAKIAASVWSIEQASSIQAISPFSCSFPFSLSRHPLETKGAERGWTAFPKKTLVHRQVTGATASKPGRGRPLPPQGGSSTSRWKSSFSRCFGRVSDRWGVSRRVLLRDTLWPPSGGRLHHDETRISPQLFNEYMNTNI